MGALVGGLYAHNPEGDLRADYREIMATYEKRTTEAYAKRGVIGGLLLAGAAVASGGAALAVAGAGAAGALAGAGSVSRRDLERFQEVLNAHFGNQRIEEQPIPFSTLYVRVEETGTEMVPVKGGLLGDAVADSVANPLIWPGLKPEEGAHLDPGMDRLAAVPLDYACRLYPDHQFIVSNVSGKPLVFTAEMHCPYEELVLAVPDSDISRTIRGQEPEFSEVIRVGTQAARTLEAAPKYLLSSPVPPPDHPADH